MVNWILTLRLSLVNLKFIYANGLMIESRSNFDLLNPLLKLRKVNVGGRERVPENKYNQSFFSLLGLFHNNNAIKAVPSSL